MDTNSEHHPRKRRLLRTSISTLVLAAVLIGGALVWNHTSLQAPMEKLIDEDPRNAGIEVSVHYKYRLQPSTLVYDLREVSGDKTPVDVFRVFLQYADAIKGERFDRVELAFRGETRFILDGTEFHEIGQEFSTQNPMYTVRTFPERLRTPDGRPAFEQWTGGALGVLSAQMDDFNDFHRRWYIDDLESP